MSSGTGYVHPVGSEMSVTYASPMDTAMVRGFHPKPRPVMVTALVQTPLVKSIGAVRVTQCATVGRKGKQLLEGRKGGWRSTATQVKD
jgi:hypothetical protein